MADEDAGERLQARGVPVPVMIQREATITRFMGYGEEPAKVETFVREVRRAWTMSPTMTEEMRLDLIKDNAGHPRDSFITLTRCNADAWFIIRFYIFVQKIAFVIGPLEAIKLLNLGHIGRVRARG